jgi:hypothetical protein
MNVSPAVIDTKLSEDLLPKKSSIRRLEWVPLAASSGQKIATQHDIEGGAFHCGRELF